MSLGPPKEVERRLIPFEHTWPYEKINDDLYFLECPACRASNVLLPLKLHALEQIRNGTKKLLVMPCCHASYKIIDADADYVLAESAMRKRC